MGRERERERITQIINEMERDMCVCVREIGREREMFVSGWVRKREVYFYVFSKSS